MRRFWVFAPERSEDPGRNTRNRSAVSPQARSGAGARRPPEGRAQPERFTKRCTARRPGLARSVPLAQLRGAASAGRREAAKHEGSCPEPTTNEFSMEGGDIYGHPEYPLWRSLNGPSMYGHVFRHQYTIAVAGDSADSDADFHVTPLHP